MQFNEFSAEKTEEVLCSIRRKKPNHPALMLGHEEVERETEHKHLQMILHDKLNFRSHIKDRILKARKGIGVIRYLSTYVSRHVLDQICKVYARPNLDYGDIVYHKYDSEMKFDTTKRVERTQFSAALAVSAVTGAWRGTSRQSLFEELGWESLYQRKWHRRVRHFFSLEKHEGQRIYKMNSC